MKPKFVTAMGILILVLAVLNVVTLVPYELTGKVLLFADGFSNWNYVSQALIYVTLVLATLFVHEFQKPNDRRSWFTLITIWGFNIFTLLFSFGIIDFGQEARPATFFILVLITLIIDCMAFFPYETFQKHEAKPQ